MSQDMLGVSVHDAQGIVTDLLEKLGGRNGRDWLSASKKFLRKENPWEAPTSFTVTTDGRTGEQYIADLKKTKYNVGDYAMDVMRKPAFASTNGQTYKLVVIKGEEFEDDDRITWKIREEAAHRGYLTPPAEVAPLLREMVSDEEIERMGLWWLIVMHKPIAGSDGGPGVLGLGRSGWGRWLSACFGSAVSRWDRGGGFVFLAPQE